VLIVGDDSSLDQDEAEPAAGKLRGMADASAFPDAERADGEKVSGLQRAATQLGTQLQKAGTNLGLQRAGTLPTENRELRHAATMPITFDVESARPFCGGLWKAQQLIGFVLGVASLIVLCAVAPLSINGASNRMLGIVLMCGCFWVFEVMPLYITALLPLVLMPLLRITSSSIASTAYWDPIQFLVIGTFLVDIALEEVHLPRRLALKLLMKTGEVQPWLLLLVFMSACWLLSMFVNNVAVCLMITPFATGLMQAAEERAAEERAAAVVEDPHHDESESTGTSLPVEPLQRFSSGLLIGIAYGTTAGGMATLIGSVPNELLMGNGPLSQQISYASWMEYAFPTSLATFVMAYLVVYWRYCRGVKIAVVTREGLEREYEELVAEIGSFSRDELTVAIVQIVQFSLLFCVPWIRQMRIFQTSFGESLIGDSTVACLPVIVLFLSPSVLRPGQSILTWPVVHEKFDFGLLLLIGGGFAIASGFVQSGLNIALGNMLASVIEEAHLCVITLVIVLVVSVATQIFSTVGTATTVIPVLISTASRAVTNPLGLVLPATAACSFAFALPMATPANIIVLAKSRDLLMPLRVRDFFLTGMPLTVIMVLLGSCLLFFMGEVVFETNGPFPKWACDDVSCLWADVPGVIKGVQVASQACTMDLTSNMTECRLVNGTWLDVSSIQVSAF